VMVKYSTDQQFGQGKKDWVFMVEQKNRPLCLHEARVWFEVCGSWFGSWKREAGCWIG